MRGAVHFRFRSCCARDIFGADGAEGASPYSSPSAVSGTLHSSQFTSRMCNSGMMDSNVELENRRRTIGLYATSRDPMHLANRARSANNT